MLYRYRSNRLETLADELAVLQRTPTNGNAAAVLRPDCVVVQHPGMGRWLQQRLAQRNGIAANIEFTLPASFIWDSYRHLLDAVPRRSAYDREALQWRILALLPGHLDKPAFAPLRAYLGDDDSGLKLWQLAQRIADLFDQYLVYRPDWIIEWERGPGRQEEADGDANWQAQLWRAVVEVVAEPMHRARLWQRLNRHLPLDGAGELEATALARVSAAGHGLPPRVAVFGVSALAPMVVDVLTRLAGLIDVHIFLLDPCREYWLDISSELGLARLRDRWRERGQSDASAYYAVGNPLLASLGGAGRELLAELQEKGQEFDHASEPQAPGILGLLQADVLDLVSRGDVDTGADQPPLPLAVDDNSLQLHACHSRMREVQVLHDQLLELFATLDALEPREVVVMAPNIDDYAAFIDAVFGNQGRIPWSVADRSLRAEQALPKTLLSLLKLPLEALSGEQVLGLLELPALRRRFGIGLDELDRVRAWIADSGIRWGLDSDDRSAAGAPAFGQNSWAFGLSRLYLGYATGSDGSDGELFDDVSPADLGQSGEAELLGHLQSLIDCLAGWRQELRRPATASQWQQRGNRLLRDFFDAGRDGDADFDADFDAGDAASIERLREVFAQLAEQAGIAGVTTPFAGAVVSAYLDSALGEAGGGRRFLTGAVTFCSLLPMRSVPFRVLCLLGMEDESFPKRQPAAGFNLMASEPRPGDRSLRDDDRYLFLEALLSAREVFSISYVGQSDRDNQARNPSVVVSELLDTIDRSCQAENGQPAHQQLLRRHPLQPFSQRYFDGSDARLFSYAEDWLPSADSGIAPFVDQPLPALDDTALQALELDQLEAFFTDPSGYFCRHRFDIRGQSWSTSLDSREPFEQSSLDSYQLADAVIHGLLEHGDEARMAAQLRATGVLPVGSRGDQVMDRIRQRAAALVARIKARRGASAQAPQRIELDHRIDGQLGAWQLSGWLDEVVAGRQLLWRSGKLRGVDQCRAWLRHLALCVALPATGSGDLAETCFVADDETLSFGPVEDAAACLAEIIKVYAQALQMPQPLFPTTSLAWAKAVKGGKAPSPAAQKAWQSSKYAAGEGDKPCIAMLFRGRDPVAEADQAGGLGELAERLMLPMLAAATHTTAAKDKP